MRKEIYLIVGMSVMIFFSCKKNPQESGVPNPDPSNCDLVKVINSKASVDSILSFYNSDHQVVKNLSFHNGYCSELDTFGYTNNLLTYSAYKGTDNPSTSFYSKTDYSYTDNVLSESIYYSFNFRDNASKCNYYFDTLKRTMTIVQTALRPGLGAQTHTTKYEFDSSLNLRKVYYNNYYAPEYLIYEFGDYDDKPNPLYKHPPFTDYDFYYYGVKSLSKNNYGSWTKYRYFTSTGVAMDANYKYDRKYDDRGLLVQMHSTNTMNPSDSSTSYYFYNCK
jgi:hypothetical protein